MLFIQELFAPVCVGLEAKVIETENDEAFRVMGDFVLRWFSKVCA